MELRPMVRPKVDLYEASAEIPSAGSLGEGAQGQFERGRVSPVAARNGGMPQPNEQGVIRCGDGRTLSYATWGDDAGFPVLSLHGSPGSRLTLPASPAALNASRIRLITYDRPGYGLSSPLPGRSVSDCEPDVKLLLDHLGLARVAVTGASGGGPHALALAALLPNRCSTVLAVVPPAPFTMTDYDWFQGMDAQNVRRFRAALRGTEAARRELQRDIDVLLLRGAANPATMWEPMALPSVDLLRLERQARHSFPGIVEGARQGAEGWAEDYFAFVRPWGFQPADVKAPVILEYGRLDVNVPPVQGDWLAAVLPEGSEIRVHPEAGHVRDPDSTVRLLEEIIKQA